MEDARQDPDRTTLSASRGDSTGVLTVLWRVSPPPLFSQANSSIDFPSHFASYPAFFLFNLSLFALHFLQAFMPLPFLSTKFVIST
jgi:hypothetical protein